jgi:hypothetical protein
MIGRLRLVLTIALGNVLASRARAALTGLVVGSAALLMVAGDALARAIDAALRRSVCESVTGDLQLYAADSARPLRIFAGLDDPSDGLAPLADFAALERALRAVPNVKQLLPMGFGNANVSRPHPLDRSLASLREAVQHEAPYADARQRVRRLLGALRHEREAAQSIDRTEPADLEALRTADTDAFWRDFERAPLVTLDWLDNRVAGLAEPLDVLFLQYVGTELPRFAQSFPRFRVVQGRSLPPGARGLMLSQAIYESQLKLKVARALDELARVELDDGPRFSRLVRDLQLGVDELLAQLDGAAGERAASELRTFLHSREPDLRTLLVQFLRIERTNLAARYAFFYRTMAPQLALYQVAVGDTLTVHATGRDGYRRSVELELYGTYRFEGLERSPQANALNLIDLTSFRQLAGLPSEESERELANLREAAGATDLTRAEVEASLFGGSAPRPRAAAPAVHATPGMVHSIAVVLDDPSAIASTRRALLAAGERTREPLKAADWRESSGMVGGFVGALRWSLALALALILVVGLIALNGALVVAALARVSEFGTLRALGSQRGFVVALVIAEAAMTGLLWGALGAGLGAALIELCAGGIAAQGEAQLLLFSGPRLFPSASAAGVWRALATMLALSVVSGLYPAWLALRVSPRAAMSAGA